MAELLLELLSEEIPARMQKGGAETLRDMLAEALTALSPQIETFHGPRRIAAVADLAAEVPATSRNERGPRTNAPDAALGGFLRKHGAAREQLIAEGDYWVLNISSPTRPAAALIAEVMPSLLRRFAWPKSMRWGGTSAFTWVRPLRRILCILDGSVVPFNLRAGDDDGHGLTSDDLTEGHRFMAPGAVRVASAADWEAKLRERKVLVRFSDRVRMTGEKLAETHSGALKLVQDRELSSEVAGLAEWPVPMLGRIDAAFMDLPPEVMQVSMRVNQRYWALRESNGNPAPYFAWVANIEAPDDGAAIIAGNERVLRARFADARHFWDLDRAGTLESRVVALGAITFHAKLGTQADRVRRITRLAAHLAPLVGADREQAFRAATLCKADLTTGMVGEFPELQGIMGAYYARHDGEAPEVATAIGEHYLPRGPSDPIPTAPVSVAVALADKLDTLTGFFGIGEAPTGSGDPYALRRAALGVLRILRGNHIRVSLRPLLTFAGQGHAAHPDVEALLAFLIDRLHVQLRADGARHDVLNAVFAASDSDDVVRLLARTTTLGDLLTTSAGNDLLVAYRRAANILTAEEKKDGPHDGTVDVERLCLEEERLLFATLETTRPEIEAGLAAENDDAVMTSLSTFRSPVDRFFQIRVNDADVAIRSNRLRLLHALRDTMNLAADFSKIEG